MDSGLGFKEVRFVHRVTMTSNFLMMFFVITKQLSPPGIGIPKTLDQVIFPFDPLKLFGNMRNVEGFEVGHVDICTLLESISRRWIPDGNRELVQPSDDMGYFDQTFFKWSPPMQVCFLTLCGVQSRQGFGIGWMIIAGKDVAR